MRFWSPYNAWSPTNNNKNLMDFMQALEEHKFDDNFRFSEIVERLDKINDNHLNHLHEITTKLQTDVSWIKKIGYFLVVSSFGTLSGFFWLIIQDYMLKR